MIRLSGRPSALSAVALAGVVAGSSLSAVGGWAWALDAAGAALVVYVLREGALMARGGGAMLAAAVASSVVAWLFLDRPGPVLHRALTESAAVAGLYTALGVLREAADSSALIRRCGEWMVRQPPGRRYAVLALGSHMIALVLNFGVLSLLGTLVMRGNTPEAAGGDPRVMAIRCRRMMSALLRGFSVMTVWSPLSLAFAVTQSVIPGLPWGRLLSIQVVLALSQLGLGWALDRRDFPPGRAAVPSARLAPEAAAGANPLYALGALVAAVMGGAILVAVLLRVRLVMGAVLMVPVSALVWLIAQRRGEGLAVATVSATLTLARRLRIALPAFRNEVAMLAGAMFLGTVVSAFVTPDRTAWAIGLIGLPMVCMPALLAWAMMLLAQVGLSQIVTVTLLGGALADLTRMGVDPLVLASTLMGAWALSTCSTTVGASILTIARLVEVSVPTVARTWNGRYVLYGALLLAAWSFALQAVLDG